MNRRGFTLIEILLVVSLTVIMAGLLAPVLFDALSRGDARSYALQAVDTLREAQSSTMSGRANARYGVHFEQNKLVMFQGAVYSAVDTNNLPQSLTGRAVITSVTLSPGGACTVATGAGNCDIHFAKVRGAPTETGSIVFTDLTGQSRTVSINAVGLIEWN